ncbi:hypothetical protein ABZ281_03750 [Streptomyces sp. NPDC006265]|uniref:hypothetical protein n=1 Tax=Streptomyces sp. NPDC006265 TaxID=3156740 RepID=UPI0033A9523D
MSSLRTPRSHTDRLRHRIADGDIGRVAGEALRVMDSSRGAWGGGWEQTLDQLRVLPAGHRRELLHALACITPCVAATPAGRRPSRPSRSRRARSIIRRPTSYRPDDIVVCARR